MEVTIAKYIQMNAPESNKKLVTKSTQSPSFIHDLW